MIGDRYGEAAAHAGLARVERRRGDLEAARGQLEAGLAIVESLRAQVLSPDLRASFLASSQDDYVFLADTLLELDGRRADDGFAPAAFAVSERARARSLVELLTEARIDVREGIAPELAEEDKELDARLWLTRSSLIRELAATAPDPAKVVSLRQRLDEITAARDDLEWRIRRDHPRYAEIKLPAAAEPGRGAGAARPRRRAAGVPAGAAALLPLRRHPRRSRRLPAALPRRDRRPGR